MEDTKLSWAPNYKSEYLVNEVILRNSVALHGLELEDIASELGLDTQDKKQYMDYRIKDVLVSATDDIIRYATYHNVLQNTTLTTGEKVYSVTEPVRASILTKWIVKLRPSSADQLLPMSHQYQSSRIDDLASLREKVHKVEFCNENLALICVSLVLNIKEEGSDRPLSYEELFNGRELSTLFYSLRYRAAHQDTYTPVFSKVFNYFNEMPR